MSYKDYDSKFTKYATDVLDGKIIAGEYCRLACKRYLKLFERDDIYFDTEAAEQPVRVMSKFTLAEDRFSGQPFKLTEWQKFVIYNIYGFKRKETKRRMFKQAFLLIARKNGKTVLCGGLALYHLVGTGEEGVEVVCGANSRAQAGLLKDKTEKFASKLNPKGNLIKVCRNTISYPKKFNVLKVLSSEAKKLDGLNPSFACIDEYHEAARDSADTGLYSVIKTGMQSRSEPILFIISTAGFNTESPCYDMEVYSRAILKGEIEDDSHFCLMFELDDDDDWKEEKNWYKASPNLGVTIPIENMRDDVKSVIQMPSRQRGFLTKNLNCWLNSTTGWIDEGIIRNSMKNPIKPKDFADKETFVGVDLAAVSDMCAVSYMVKESDGFHFHNKYYLPKIALEKGINAPLYRKWYNEGYLTITESKATDYDRIEYDLKNDKEFIKKIRNLSYDPFNSTQFINSVNKNLRIQTTPFSQTLGNFNRPTKEFERLMLEGHIFIDYNPITEWMFGNVELKFDDNENVKPTKGNKNSARKIDGVISMLECLGYYLETYKTIDLKFS